MGQTPWDTTSGINGSWSWSSFIGICPRQAEVVSGKWLQEAYDIGQVSLVWPTHAHGHSTQEKPALRLVSVILFVYIFFAFLFFENFAAYMRFTLTAGK